MKAAVLVTPLNIEIQDIEAPTPRPGEVIVRPSLAGLCGSDHSVYNGKFDIALPVVPGHEAIGEIVALGSDVTDYSVGQRVVIQPNFACGTCTLCQTGHDNICSEKIRLGIDVNGVLAEFVAVPAKYVWAVPEDMEDSVAVFIEPLAVAVHGVNKVTPRAKDRVLVIGAGIIGLLTLQVAKMSGAAITSCDLEEVRLTLAEKVGASNVLSGKDSYEPFYNSFDVIYETSGSPAALDLAVKMAAPGAQIVIYSLPSQDAPVNVQTIVRKELQIVGSMIYTNEFPQVIEILKTGQIQTEALTSSRLPLSEVQKGLDNFSSPSRIKILVDI